MSRAASRSKVLDVAPVGTESPRSQDARQEAAARAREEERRFMDPISEPLDYGPWAGGQNVAQCFGQAVIDDHGGDVSRLPKWRFRRRYLAQKVIIDTFLSQKHYDEAQVEERRAMAHKYGFRYAALGPSHSIQPHEDKARREKFPSQVEQLGYA